jgi:SRSO17 transposase
MIRTQVYLTEEQARDIKLQAKRENKAEAEAEVIRELVNTGLDVSQRANRETAGGALLRLARLGEELQVQAPADLSSRIDEYLYGENK